MALTALERSEVRIDALRETLCEFFQTNSSRNQYLAMMSGLDIRYDLGEGHPLLGRRMPDLDLLTATGSLRVFTLLHKAKAVLVNFGASESFHISPWASRVQQIDAKCEAKWHLPVIGEVPHTTAVLIRPDGYVAWLGDKPDSALVTALTKWFGPPTTN
jgi:hypothetical protein